jgi:type IX secretion system PorP/SprF family membrane protein
MKSNKEQQKYHTMKRIIIIMSLLGCISAYGQQDPMFTHYMYNTLSVNPGYAGSRDAMTVTALHRAQWVDFKGAPVTQTLTLHTPVWSNQIGLGLSFVHDKIGPTEFTNIYADFAYRIQLTEKSKLAFGLKGGVNILTADLQGLKLDEPGDAAFNYNFERELMPNFGFGIYYSRERFYAGISTPKLLEQKYYEGSSQGAITAAREKGHYYLIAGTVFPLSSYVDLKPSGLLKMTPGAPIEMDITAIFDFDQRFNAGLMYRTGDAIGVLCGLNLSEQFMIGYSFDYSTTNKTFKYNEGSHEVMLRYDFIFGKNHRIKSPRYF